VLSQQSTYAADTGATLSAIADTADRICGIVATHGEASAGNAAGDVHAELSGLAKRLASLGVSAKGDITSSSYQGVLQQDLLTALKENSDCKLKVLDKLQATILPGVPPETAGLEAPSTTLLQSPSSDYGLYRCIRNATAISCYIVITRTADGQQDYQVANASAQKEKLIDNFHVEHRLHDAFFIDGLGQHQQHINLSTGESVWFGLEFEPGTQIISSARIIFSPYGNNQLRGPVL
jgi:hypothetical protein